MTSWFKSWFGLWFNAGRARRAERLLVGTLAVAILSFGRPALPSLVRPARAEAPDNPAPATQDRRPPAMRKVHVTEHLGARLPLAAQFRDVDDQPVQLRNYFDGRRPVLLTLAYLNCPMLCSLVLNGVATAVRRLKRSPARDFRLVTIALDPTEATPAAAEHQHALNRDLRRKGSRDAWVYLRGKDAQVHAVADALGFGYAWDPRSERYAHPAVAFVVTGGGIISKYFHGLQFVPAQLDTALGAAATGDIAVSVGQTVLSCFRFDPALRRHRERIQGMFRLGATVLFGTLLTLVLGLYLHERRRRR